jgi:hypothetical protein
MRERWVDIALISALVLIAGTIVFTLFGSPRPRVQAGTAPQVNTAGEQPVTATSEEVVPVAPLEESTTGENTAQQTVGEQVTNEQTANEQIANEQDTSNQSVSEINPTPSETPETVTPETRAPLPEGAVELERIGFSYVTGGTGSCNIVLEPWQHVAVSLDLRETYPCGSEITITLNEEVAGRTSFKAIVGDSIRNAERTVNVYVGEDEPALEYGIKDGQLNP